MKYCYECGYQFDTGTENFCLNCGQGLESEVTISGCGTIMIGDNFVFGLFGPKFTAQIQLTSISNEYVQSLIAFSNTIESHLKGRQNIGRESKRNKQQFK